ncbi:methyltransferase domain-containing protein [Prosthecobacter sp. SYSU 5D2]|uniref:methyltransferase domain-containing protein n=1 Tax=Prosthecobacter sp. SYSU 5D2 TaxID=3134134 RepID=UPI0031FEF02B
MTDWESCYQEGNTPWDKGAPSPPLSAWVKKNHPQGRALVPGCGTGHDVVMLVEAGMDAAGVDLSSTAIEKARGIYPAYAARFHLGDLFQLPADWHCAFDYVFEHTCLCALPPQWRSAYAATVHGLLRPGGSLAGIWFVDPEMDPGETGPPFGISVPELDGLFPPELWEMVEDDIPDTAYEGRAGRERLRVLRKRP